MKPLASDGCVPSSRCAPLQCPGPRFVDGTSTARLRRRGVAIPSRAHRRSRLLGPKRAGHAHSDPPVSRPPEIRGPARNAKQLGPVFQVKLRPRHGRCPRNGENAKVDQLIESDRRPEKAQTHPENGIRTVPYDPPMRPEQPDGRNSISPHDDAPRPPEVVGRNGLVKQERVIEEKGRREHAGAEEEGAFPERSRALPKEHRRKKAERGRGRPQKQPEGR